MSLLPGCLGNGGLIRFGWGNRAGLGGGRLGSWRQDRRAEEGKKAKKRKRKRQQCKTIRTLLYAVVKKFIIIIIFLRYRSGRQLLSSVSQGSRAKTFIV